MSYVEPTKLLYISFLSLIFSLSNHCSEGFILLHFNFQWNFEKFNGIYNNEILFTQLHTDTLASPEVKVENTNS